MKTYKIVLVDTNDISVLSEWDVLMYNNKGWDPHIVNNKHLYVLSHENLKSGEWCFESHEDYECNLDRFKDEDNPSIAWFLRKINMNYTVSRDIMFRFGKSCNCMKIIATTNPICKLPKIPKIFITKFIEEYNSGKKIKSVTFLYDNI